MRESTPSDAAIQYIIHPSALGALVLATTSRGLCGIYFEQHKYFGGHNAWQHNPAHPTLTAAARQLDAYFAGTLTRFDVPLDLLGTPFQRSVWQQLMAIEFGETVSYGTHAARVGKPQAVRAVGTAIGRNPVSIIVPCHRVVGKDGGLNGYAGGLDRKRFLLALEVGR
ncbi:methylated-DNA-[protein]-cysteine S-methyltransferase [Actimicrobium sp. GrIS 1.19]|uniref:methylated-DNA--[protein]-cysteine S-methyltransferase n=1 Tax=Actimicrobium sp. GrIS 1.19 TaxID=3071708 RepID=UPI002DFD61D2|nr:methylated-DNA-[protein]-cysteine S-methyltransferase [Actimicrobium sp. GrIS 1.19]